MAYLIYDIGTGNSRVSIVSEQKEMIGLRTFENRYYSMTVQKGAGWTVIWTAEVTRLKRTPGFLWWRPWMKRWTAMILHLPWRRIIFTRWTGKKS